MDVSIQNAGVTTIARVKDLTEKEWDKVVAVNTKGVFLCCQAAAKIMIKQGSGKLVNTASGQARQGFIYTPHYAASKMGVVGITQSLAKELAAHGITVNTLIQPRHRAFHNHHLECKRGALSDASQVAGTGFEPVTSGL